MGLNKDLKAIATPLFFEMQVCENIGMTHMEFIQLPREEKTKWYLYYELKYKKEKQQHDEMLEKMRNKGKA